MLFVSNSFDLPLLHLYYCIRPSKSCQPKLSPPEPPTDSSSARLGQHSTVSPSPRSKNKTDTRTDDTRLLLGARQQAREQFDSHRRQGIDTPMQIKHAVEVADILRHNIVQGSREAGDEDAQWRRFRLRFILEGS